MKTIDRILMRISSQMYVRQRSPMLNFCNNPGPESGSGLWTTDPPSRIRTGFGLVEVCAVPVLLLYYIVIILGAAKAFI